MVYRLRWAKGSQREDRIAKAYENRRARSHESDCRGSNPDSAATVVLSGPTV